MNTERNGRDLVYDLREYVYPKAAKPFVHAAPLIFTFRDWSVEVKTTSVRGEPILLVGVTPPDGSVFNFVTGLIYGMPDVRDILAHTFSAEVGLAFRAEASAAEKIRCINILRRVVDAAKTLPQDVPGDIARFAIECGMFDVNREQAETFCGVFKQVTTFLGNGEPCQWNPPIKIVAAFIHAGWNPTVVAELYYTTSAQEQKKISTRFIRSTATHTMNAATLLNWAGAFDLVTVSATQMPLARRYMAAGWSFHQMSTDFWGRGRPALAGWGMP